MKTDSMLLHFDVNGEPFFIHQDFANDSIAQWSGEFDGYRVLVQRSQSRLGYSITHDTKGYVAYYARNEPKNAGDVLRSLGRKLGKLMK